MKMNITLSQGYTPKKFKAAMYLTGTDPHDALIVEAAEKGIMAVAGNLYDFWTSMFGIDMELDVKRDGLEDKAFYSLSDKLLEEFKERRAQIQ